MMNISIIIGFFIMPFMLLIVDTDTKIIRLEMEDGTVKFVNLEQLKNKEIPSVDVLTNEQPISEQPSPDTHSPDYKPSEKQPIETSTVQEQSPEKVTLEKGKRYNGKCECSMIKEKLGQDYTDRQDYTDGQDYEDYIVGGKVITSPRPWLARVHYSNKPSKHLKADGICAGAIINKRYILTASHCVCGGPKPSRKNPRACKEGGKDSGKLLYNPKLYLWVILGINNKEKYSLAFDETDHLYYVDHVVEHPDFRDATYPHDLALIKVDRDIEFKRNKIMPLCLPKDDSEINLTKKTFTENRVYSSGWGKIREFCTTDGNGPIKHMKCKLEDKDDKAKCSKTPPPNFKLGLCSRFKKSNKDKYPQKKNSAVRIIDKTRKSHVKEQICYADVTGPLGWCDTLNEESKTNKRSENWGWCNPSVCRDGPAMENKLREVRMQLLPLEDCNYFIKWNADNRNNDDTFDDNIELCAGTKHQFPHIHTYIKNRNKKTRQTEYISIIGNEKLNETDKGLLKYQNWDLDYYIGGGDTCGGDSGGPLYTWIDGIPTAIGVVSRGGAYTPRNLDVGVGCGEFNYPGIYTRISKFLDWIQENSKDGDC